MIAALLLALAAAPPPLAHALSQAYAHQHKWHGVAAAVRDELGSFFTGQSANAKPTYGISTPGVDASSITDIHVVFSNHLDVGFNVRAWCDGPDGCVSPEDSKTGLPCRPWAYWVLNENINTFLPRAIDTADAMRAAPLPGPDHGHHECSGNHGNSTPCCGQCTSTASCNPAVQCPATQPTCTDYIYDSHMGHCTGGAALNGSQPMANGTKDRYIYMTQSWVVAFFLDCAHTGLRDWRNPQGGLGPEIIQCPNATTIAKFKAAVQRGDIFWHAFPHNAQPGTYEPSLFESSLAMGARIAAQLNVSAPVCFSQRDETGMTRAILPLLNKAGVKMISLGSGGSSGGHPVIPDLFVWRDPASKAEVLFVHDHGYGGGMHVLPNGHAVYCAWNTDNGGPQKVESVQSTFSSLRKKYPQAKVYASTFEQFYAHASADPATMAALPVVTQEIGDTWLYGCPSDPLKNVVFREISRRRAECVAGARCNVEDLTMQRFDRLLTKIPEHTWGEDTTWYLHDYDNWTNPQISSAMHQDNYNMTVESWREQRSYLTNSISVLEDSAQPQYVTFGAELRKALKALEPHNPQPASSGFKRQSSMSQQCGAVQVRFGEHGDVAALHKGATGWSGSLGGFVYQSLSSGNFTAFCADYGNKGCKAETENPGCHNFHKPNMSSADPEYMVVRPRTKALWRRADKHGGCTFLLEAALDEDGATGVHTKYGAPSTVWTQLLVDGTAASSPAEGAATPTSVMLTSTWFNKTTTRMAEASWVSFVPDVQEPSTGWSIASLGAAVDPTDVVAHGATHLHAMGADGAMVYDGKDGHLSIASLDVPVVSTGLLSPFPTPGDNTTIAGTLELGMHWNVQNNVWNVDYPQWYPFEGVYGYGNGGEQDGTLGRDAAFRFRIDF